MCMYVYIYIYIYIYISLPPRLPFQGLPCMVRAARPFVGWGLPCHLAKPLQSFTSKVLLIGSSGMWCLRMFGLKLVVDWPSNTEGVGTSHLKLIWVRGLQLEFWDPTSWNTTSLNTQAKQERYVCRGEGRAQAQNSLENKLVEHNNKAGSLYNFFGQGYGYEYHSS